MNIEQQLQELASQTCGREVDVTDRVMEQVMAHPYLQPRPKRVNWRIIAPATAAAVLLAVVVNVAVVRSHTYDEEQIGGMIAQVYDYENYIGSSTIESAAENEYFYDE